MIDLLLKLVCACALAAVFIHIPRLRHRVDDRKFLARTVKDSDLWPSLKNNK
jgi:hypothetical protein